MNFWATDVKGLWFLDGFAGKYGNVAPEFGDYPPAIQLFKWFFLHMSGGEYREGLGFAGYVCLNFILLLPLISKVDRIIPEKLIEESEDGLGVKIAKNKKYYVDDKKLISKYKVRVAERKAGPIGENVDPVRNLGILVINIIACICLILFPTIANIVCYEGTCVDVTMGIIFGNLLFTLIFNLKRRYPIADIYFFPSQVQGENAPKELLQAFNLSLKYPLDTIIIGRGGGASEDLSAFNDEKLVRAIAESKIPVIAAIGHEIDSTLVDYVADKRASTPTGAAELATIDRREIELHFQDAIETMQSCLREQVEEGFENLEDYKDDLNSLINEKINLLKQKIELRDEQLASLSPKGILNRGYSITLDENGKPITKASSQKPGNKIKTIYYEGETISTIDEVKGD